MSPTKEHFLLGTGMEGHSGESDRRVWIELQKRANLLPSRGRELLATLREQSLPVPSDLEGPARQLMGWLREGLHPSMVPSLDVNALKIGARCDERRYSIMVAVRVGFRGRRRKWMAIVVSNAVVEYLNGGELPSPV